MNIIKGMDRIAWVVAIIAMLIGFIAGFGATYETLSPEYIKWLKQGRAKTFTHSMNPANHFDYLEDQDGKAVNGVPTKYKYSSIGKSIGMGLLLGIINFAMVFYGIRYGTRGIARLSIWIIEGFKDDKRNKEPELNELTDRES